MSRSLLWIIILVVIIGGAVWFLSKSSKTTQAPSQTVAQVSPTVSPTSPSGIVQTAQEKTVTVTANGFDPTTITIKAGEKVTWTNKSGGGVSINSAEHPTHLVYPPLNLGQVKDGASVSLTFDKPGSYKYHNHLAPSQAGTVVVQ